LKEKYLLNSLQFLAFFKQAYYFLARINFMIYLITGATGLVGQHIVRQCEEQNIVVHYLTTSKSKIQKTDTYKGFYWDPSANYIDKKAFEGVSKIIHLAGATVAKRWTKSYKQIILDSRINSTALLKQALLKIEHNVTHFISASAIGIYESSLEEFHKENSTYVGEDFLACVVKEWEKAVDSITELNIKVSKVRIGLVLHEKEGALPKIVKPIKMYAGAAFGKGSQWQSWIHVKDLASIFMFVAKGELSGIYNAVAPNAVTQNKLISSCADILSKPIWLPNIPRFVAKLIMGEMSALLLASQRVSSAKIEEEGFLFEFPSLRKALQYIFNRENTFKL